MVIPQWLSKYLKDSDLQKIEQAVIDAEKLTSAEIIPVVVRASSSYAQVPVTLTLLGVILFLTVFDSMEFEDQWGVPIKILIFCVVGFATTFFALPRLARFDAIKRWLSPRALELECVTRRAKVEFFQNCLHETAGQTGVLIYISLLERRVMVLADKKIAAHFPPETWQKVVDHIVLAIKNKQMGEGLKTAIASVADLLTGPFPIASNDSNELPNGLIIKE
jgi:putative membrane protein